MPTVIETLRSEDGGAFFQSSSEYSKSLTSSNVGDPSKVEFLRTIFKFRKREEIS